MTVQETEPGNDRAGSRRATWVKVVVGVAALVALVVGGPRLKPYVGPFLEWIEGLGPWGPLAFMLGYAVATVAFVPGLILSLAAGAVFGVVWGTAYVLVGATAGAAAAFLVARHLARSAIEQKLEAYPRFRAVDRAVGREGFKIVALLRLSPVFPFNLLNYALGLTKVRFVHYLVASVFMLPGTLLYVYSGSLAGDALKAAAGSGGERGAAEWVLLVVGLAATLGVTVYVTRLARRALKEEVEDV